MESRTNWCRGLAVFSAVILFICTWQAVRLFSPPAPFAQHYLETTVAQDAEITRQLVATLIVAPHLSFRAACSWWRVPHSPLFDPVRGNASTTVGR